MLKKLIEDSISFTKDEKDVLVKNIDSFSDEDKEKLIKILEEEQYNLVELKENYYKNEKNIIIKYIKKILRLGNLKKLNNIGKKIKEIREKEKVEEIDANMFLDDQLNNL